ncbi:MAG: hypothetical protein WCI91_01160 [Candidatus Nomurabacteria bacterium]
MIKTEIFPPGYDNSERRNDIERYEKVFSELSLMHLDHSDDPAILCDVSFREFKGEYWPSVPGAQHDLLMIAIKYELSWTK